MPSPNFGPSVDMKFFNHRIIVTLAGLNARIGEQADVTLPM